MTACDVFCMTTSPKTPIVPFGIRQESQDDGRPHARPTGLLQEAIDYPALLNRGRAIWLVVTGIAEHVCQHLGIEDTPGRRHEGAEVFLAVEGITKADALGGEVRRGDARAFISGDLHAL